MLMLLATKPDADVACNEQRVPADANISAQNRGGLTEFDTYLLPVSVSIAGLNFNSAFCRSFACIAYIPCVCG